ncbi:MAG: RNA 2',3'-cyclic phosphodiesterase [Chloroflexota bacterium]
MEELVRCFVAIELNEEARSALAALQARLKGADRTAAQAVKWVAPQGIHLTLKFLGQVPRARVQAIVDALRNACRGGDPFELSLAGAGCFPSPQSPRVLWVGLEGDLERLASLQQAVEGALVKLGFPPEDRPFQPHLTLGRVRETAGKEERRRLGLAARALPGMEGTKVPVAAVSLIRSHLRPEGAVYEKLAELPLQP